MRVLRGIAALAVGLSALSLAAGCGGGTAGAPSTSTESRATESHPTQAGSGTTPTVTPTPLPAAPAARGPRVTGDGYAFRLPRGWREVTDQLSGAGRVDVAAGSHELEHGFRSNLNVVVDRRAISEDQLSAALDRIDRRMRGAAPSYDVRGPVRVAGGTAGHLSGGQRSDGTRVWIEQFVLPHGQRTWIVSFSFSPRMPAQRRERTTAEVLRTWHWR